MTLAGFSHYKISVLTDINCSGGLILASDFPAKRESASFSRSWPLAILAPVHQKIVGWPSRLRKKAEMVVIANDL